MKALVTDNGGTIGSTVTAKTNFLVSRWVNGLRGCLRPLSSEVGTTKYNAAVSKGIPIVTKNDTAFFVHVNVAGVREGRIHCCAAFHRDTHSGAGLQGTITRRHT